MRRRLTLAVGWASACALAAYAAASRPSASAHPSVLVSSAAASSRVAPPAQNARTIVLTANEHMRFDRREIPAKGGEPLHVVLKAIGALPKAAMAHNFVLVQRGTDLGRFNAASFNARETDYIPPEMKDAVIASTGLAGAGESVDVTFAAPPAAGRYPYFCSFPGHYAQGMHGVLVVR